jgi:hypothetical protein
MKPCKSKYSEFVDNPQVKRKRQNSSMPTTQEEVYEKSDMAKPKSITDVASYLIDVVWYGRLCTNLKNQLQHEQEDIKPTKTT